MATQAVATNTRRYLPTFEAIQLHHIGTSLRVQMACKQDKRGLKRTSSLTAKGYLRQTKMYVIVEEYSLQMMVTVVLKYGRPRENSTSLHTSVGRRFRGMRQRHFPKYIHALRIMRKHIERIDRLDAHHITRTCSFLSFFYKKKRAVRHLLYSTPQAPPHPHTTILSSPRHAEHLSLWHIGYPQRNHAEALKGIYAPLRATANTSPRLALFRSDGAFSRRGRPQPCGLRPTLRMEVESHVMCVWCDTLGAARL